MGKITLVKLPLCFYTPSLHVRVVCFITPQEFEHGVFYSFLHTCDPPDINNGHPLIKVPPLIVYNLQGAESYQGAFKPLSIIIITWLGVH